MQQQLSSSGEQPRRGIQGYLYGQVFLSIEGTVVVLVVAMSLVVSYLIPIF